MIQLIMMLTSLLIQFGTIEYPYNVGSINAQHRDLVISLLNSVVNSSSDSWQHYHAMDLLNNLDSILVITDDNGYNIIYPIEVADSSYNSTMNVTARDNDGTISVRGSNIAAFFLNSSGSFNRGELFIYGTDFSITEQFVYTELPFPYNDIDTFSFGKQNEHLPPTALEPSGKNDKPVDDTVLDTPGNTFINNSLNYISNFSNGIFNNITDGFNGVFYYLEYFTHIPTSEEIVDAFNGSLLGQNFHLFTDVQESFRDNFIITTPNNFVLNFTIPFMGNNYPFVLDCNGIFGVTLMQRLRKILTAFIYVAVVFMLIHDIPHTLQGLNGFGGGK